MSACFLHRIGSQVVRVMLAGESQITRYRGARRWSVPISAARISFLSGGIVNVPAFYVMAAPEIKSIRGSERRDRRRHPFRLFFDFAMRYVLQKHGLRPEKDVTLLQLGGMIELATALSKRLDRGGDASSPADLRARKSGAQELVNMATTGVSFPQSAIVTTSILRTGAPGRCFELSPRLRGRNAKNDDGQNDGKKVIEKYTRESDPEILESTYRYGVDYIAPIPYPAKEG